MDTTNDRILLPLQLGQLYLSAGASLMNPGGAAVGLTVMEGGFSLMFAVTPANARRMAEALLAVAAQVDAWIAEPPPAQPAGKKGDAS